MVVTLLLGAGMALFIWAMHKALEKKLEKKLASQGDIDPIDYED